MPDTPPVGRNARFAAAAFALLAALALLAMPAQATFPGSNGKIAFVASNPPSFLDGCIQTVNPDGSSRAELVPPCPSVHPGLANPAWSADGRQLAYDDGDSIFHVTDGANPTRVWALGVRPSGISWSPDGSKLVSAVSVFFADGTSFAELFTVNVDGSGYTSVSEGVWASPDWSPDGTKIAVVRSGIETLAPDGTGRTSVTPGISPSWSPDGRKLAFSLAPPGSPAAPHDVWSANADGTGPVNLTNTPDAFEGQPVWSPDGKKIAYASNSDVHVMNADGTGRSNITNTPTVRELVPDWQPIPGPRRADYKNQSTFCRAERDFLGEQQFRTKYGAGANAHGKCVSGK